VRIALVIADSLRADAASCCGGRAHTPFIDRLATEGCAFESVLSCAPWTVPSLSSLVTGVYAHRLGVYRWEQPIPPEHDSVFAVLADAGYRVASFVFDPDWLFCCTPEARVMGSSQHAQQVFDWISGCPDPNLFVLIHYWGTHFPYVDRPMTVPAWKAVTDKILKAWNQDPATVRGKIRGLYDRAVERFSERFLPGVVHAVCKHASPEGAAVLVTADHGESWAERLDAVRDVFDLHGNHLRNEVLRVPLWIWRSETREHRVIRRTVRTVDLAPTLTELAGVRDAWPNQGSNGLDGISVAVLMRAEEAGQERSSIACSSRDFVASDQTPPQVPSELWTAMSLQRGRYKLVWTVRTCERTVFDLSQDPDERRPLPVGSGEPEDAWAELQREWDRATCAPAPDPGERHLRSLGYLE
jgi:arylsulfatase A-like enzyme